MKQIAVITSPLFLTSEPEMLTALFEAGLELLHLRKPGAAIAEYEGLLRVIPEQYHRRIRLHSFFELADRYDVMGVHLNRRNPHYTGTRPVGISRSCHSIDELRQIDQYDYVFLSPIFDSISKEGYGSGFSEEELRQASDAGLIHERVFALGGIDNSTLPLLNPYPFGGVALLGTIWRGGDSVRNYRTIKDII